MSLHPTHLLLTAVFFCSSCSSGAVPAGTALAAYGEPCSTALDCAANLACAGGVCTAPLLSDAEVGDSATAEISQPADANDATSDAENDVEQKLDVCVPTCLPSSCTDTCGGATCTGPCVDNNPCTVGDTCKGGMCAPGAPKPCPTAEPCVNAACSVASGSCVLVNKPEGTGCDDGDACSQADACAAGVCTGQKLDCDDKNPCTGDVCNPKSGCTHLPVPGPCNDGNLCTVNDNCAAGICVPGKTKNCNDASVCTKDSCKVATGACANDPGPFDGTSCDADGSLCTVADACVSGVCTPGAKANCDDGNPCTADLCNVATGCKNSPITGTCNADDNACTIDLCVSGVCTAGTAKVCNDGNPCTADSCGVSTGLCVFAPVPDGNGCNADGSLCTDQDFCKSGICTPGPTLDCDDGNVCTTDQCLAPTGCIHDPNSGPCDADGSDCTANDSCSNTVCTAGTKLDCDDKNVCTNDACDLATGCTHTDNTLTCDDGDDCTQNDACATGKCAGVPFKCDPCLKHGGTALTLTADHIVVCTGQVTLEGVDGIVLSGGWNLCSKSQMLTWAPAKSSMDVEGLQEFFWASDPCTVMYSASHYGYSAVGNLNAGGSWQCENGWYMSQSSRILACHD